MGAVHKWDTGIVHWGQLVEGALLLSVYSGRISKLFRQGSYYFCYLSVQLVWCLQTVASSRF